MNQSLPRSTPESHGIRSSAVVSFIDAIERQKLELHSMMLLRHGHVVAEGWWAPYRAELLHNMFSLSKSFTSTAIGLAIAEGKLSLDDQVISFFPEEAPARPSANLAAMKVRHLLCMGTGHAVDSFSPPFRYENQNWTRFILQQDVPYEPGTHFVYNSGATYLLSAILQKATGETLLDYLTPRLFKPLNIEGATWESSPQGINTGGWGLSVKTEDIAKFGQLYLQRGQWNGVQLIPETWVEEATSKQIDNGDDPLNDWNQGYGYQFWRCRHDVYRGDGAFGQFCIVMPKQDAVLAITSAANDMQAVMSAVWEHLLPAMGQAELASDEQAYRALQDRLGSLQIDPPVVEATSATSAEVNGRQYKMEEGGFGIIHAVTLHAQGERSRK
jgi:CubicO group peptidase (beta-lactamase class C family)